MTHECSGCPKCNAESAATLRDRDPKSLSARYAAMTSRVLKALGASRTHPAALNTVPAPSQSALADALHKTPSPLAEVLQRTKAPIGPKSPADQRSVGQVKPAPSMTDAIKKERSK